MQSWIRRILNGACGKSNPEIGLHVAGRRDTFSKMKSAEFLAVTVFVFLAASASTHAAGVPEVITKAVEHADRPEEDRARDADRRPGEVLAFLGIEPGMTVADLIAGSGYYSDILCRVVGPDGKVYLQNNSYVLERFGKVMEPAIAKRLSQPELAHCVRLDSELDALPFEEGELDAVLMVLFYHDTYWQKVDREKMNAQVLRALAPGGVYGIVDHHAETGSRDRDVKTIHRVDAEMVKEEILAAGFTLEAESQILRHPDDDLSKNVFAPGIRGKTDRFVYKFRKPK